MGRAVIKDGSSSKLTVSFYNELGMLAAPSSATVQIQCLTTGTEIRAEQAITPGTQVTIDLTTSENAMVNEANAEERRRVTIRALYGAGDGINEQYDYVVKNLSQV